MEGGLWPSRELGRGVELCFPGCDPVGNAEFNPGQGDWNIPCFSFYPNGKCVISGCLLWLWIPLKNSQTSLRQDNIPWRCRGWTGSSPEISSNFFLWKLKPCHPQGWLKHPNPPAQECQTFSLCDSLLLPCRLGLGRRWQLNMELMGEGEGNVLHFNFTLVI